MEYLRRVRQRRALSVLDLAALTGISARRIAELEFGLARLSPAEGDTLALVLGLNPADLRPTAQWSGRVGSQTTTLRIGAWSSVQVAAALLAATLATGALGSQADQLAQLRTLRFDLSRASSSELHQASEAAWPPADIGGATRGVEPTAARAGAAALHQRTLVTLHKQAALLDEAMSPPLLVSPPPPPMVAPAPLPVIATAPAFELTPEGPRGCPVQPTSGRVVITQGYGVGTHAPAAIWGAIDLAVDGNGDGVADHAGSWYQPIVATHEGQVTVNLDSDPGGNHVAVQDPSGVWRTSYSHLALVTVASGQFVRAGDVIGFMGSTGMSTGPHLDYQVWRYGVNLDPTPLVGC